ncbi:uncharacterized protein LOC122858054 isoform X2 [Aphidius gifuensis]|uniref:uncharacterized protein LOC122858054 isoform X2 n=1 Tax=Aphidius gifuensis TaxID=684658 RepID=UPI001CDBEDAC|nr:uncharacterized protein LOC122858054 isoform X2 [Aphidius gifuensis]
MAGLYPNLHEKFRDENICPICLYEMEDTPKYSCINRHTMCHRCKPYYYSCPTCQSPLELIMVNHQGHNYHPPPAIHFMPHPYPLYPPNYEPSAPFIDQEKVNWSPPAPHEDQEIHPCQYAYLGCRAKIPEHLIELHRSRCQYRINEDDHSSDDNNDDEGIAEHCKYHVVGCNVKLIEWRRLEHEKICIYKDRMGRSEYQYPSNEDDHSSNDDNSDEGTTEHCKYHVVGCNVKLIEWRRLEHEKICIYKDRMQKFDDINENLESLNIHDDSDDSDDPEEIIECKFRTFGCMVKMPRRKKWSHEEKCNYNKYHNNDNDEDDSCYVTEEYLDPDDTLSCRWADFGCQVQPRRCRIDTHEEKCNYRREHCKYSDNGCREMVEPPKRFIHEQRCEYAW